MVEQILLSSGSFDRVREIGGFGQPLHTLYPQIQAVLANELGSQIADLLAEPVVDRAHNRIDWYAEGDSEHRPIALSLLPQEQRQPILVQVQAQLELGRELAARYATSDDPQRMQLGAILNAALGMPTETDIFLVGDRPVVAHWGFTSDRPWEVGGPVRCSRASPASPLPPEVPAEGALPDVTAPEQAPNAAAAPAIEDEAPQHPESTAVESSAELPLELPPEQLPDRLAAVFVDTTKTAPPPLPSEPILPPPPEAPSPPLLKSSPPPVTNNPSASLRYVVVGSRYFWAVVVLAVLLALGIFLGVSIQSSRPALTGGWSEAMPEAMSDASLSEAWRVQQTLQAQLEQRLVQLAARHARCPLPVDVENPSSAIPTMPGTDAHPLATDAARSPLRDEARPGVSPIAADTGARRSEREAVSDRVSSLADTVHASDGARPSRPVTSPSPAPGKPALQTLEEALQSGQSTVSAPEPQPQELPIQTESTPEERQEFTDRLSATGATTGEITATLLWNGKADLDLVVYCPSDQMLDYQNPQECGGTLDVDANTARGSLSDRPVENVFWPAGQAEPGTYRIAVRYAPRKDEQAPQPTPFQIRLVRDGQEAVFKGVVQPYKAAPVTNFIVEHQSP
ncbi:MAG: hypothetical protein H6974_01685 [Gammaproteobacteria bacterium]|nr:hypothetical protein [Gammaproteobacteria bacterium]MCP5195498.1 hypothetical protein [Gammaproteobacteria bacterium]